MTTRILKGAVVIVRYEDSSEFRKEFIGTATGKLKAIQFATVELSRMVEDSAIESVTVMNLWSKIGETVQIEMTASSYENKGE